MYKTLGKIKEVEFNLIDKKVITTYDDETKITDNRLYKGGLHSFCKHCDQIEDELKKSKYPIKIIEKDEGFSGYREIVKTVGEQQ